MKVNFYATLRQITGQKTIEFDIQDGATVQQLLDAVLDQFPPLRTELLDDNGDLYRHVHLFVNGRDVPFLEEKTETVIQSTDKIDLFPAVGGGSDQVTDVRTVRGIPIWLLREYLESLGGTSKEDGRIQGDGWSATLTKAEDFRIGSLRVGQVKMEIKGESEPIAELQKVLQVKLMRAGG